MSLKSSRDPTCQGNPVRPAWWHFFLSLVGDNINFYKIIRRPTNESKKVMPPVVGKEFMIDGGNEILFQINLIHSPTIKYMNSTFQPPGVFPLLGFLGSGGYDSFNWCVHRQTRNPSAGNITARVGDPCWWSPLVSGGGAGHECPRNRFINWISHDMSHWQAP